jgi:hypothetical protein
MDLMKKILLSLFLCISIIISSCKKDVVDPNEGELVTTFKLEFTEKITRSKQSFEFKDLDGEGGNAPSKFDDIILSIGKTYECKLQLLNESVMPVDNITFEIEAEADDHQFYFTSSVAGLTVTDLNKDTKGLPLGVESIWTTGNAATGSVNISLKHKPGNKAANDPITKGDTDISLDFKVKVQ